MLHGFGQQFRIRTNKNTEKEDLSGFTFEGPEINLIKKRFSTLQKVN
jgi:hypothetical protein